MGKMSNDELDKSAATEISENLPPRGVPFGGFKAYSDCTPGHSVTCCRPDCINCQGAIRHSSKRATEEALTLAYFYREICKQFHAERPLPPRIMGIMNHFDPNFNAHATQWNWTKINDAVKQCAKAFWNFKE